jgi:2,4-didehydro-3-deoxy-L-rhamnonate hydrolase
MRLVSYREDHQERLGVLLDDQVVPAHRLLDDGPTTMAELLAAGADGLDRLRAAAAEHRPVAGGDGARRLADLDLLAPVPRPPKIVAVGLNYHAHAGEQAKTAPVEPRLFAKYPTAVIGSGAVIRWDPDLTAKVDFEGELAVVIGRPTRRVDRPSALRHVLGYMIGNDVSARDLQDRDGQFTRAKSLDTFCPMGPILVTADEVPDPQTLHLTTTVNGERMQDANTASMIHSVADVIVYASRAFSLEPGDVLMTGTPAGVGHHRKPARYLHDGDEVAIEIQGLGRLVNRCHEESPAERGPVGG